MTAKTATPFRRTPDVIAQLVSDKARLIEALRSALASLDQMAKLGRIPESNQGARDARTLLRELEGK